MKKRTPKGRSGRTRRPTRVLIGWREWVALPDLRVPAIKVKIDTGARTSALHAENIEIFERRGLRYARFWVFPVQRSRRNAILCEAPVVDRRTVTDSGGHREERWIIRTRIRIAEDEWETEVSLTNRDAMTFRMLLGRATLGRRFVIHPGASFLVGEPRSTGRRKRRLRVPGE
ncbi:MAG: ATP-dependent zinc protease family protein [bacterium JZ-2024 1]